MGRLLANWSGNDHNFEADPGLYRSDHALHVNRCLIEMFIALAYITLSADLRAPSPAENLIVLLFFGWFRSDLSLRRLFHAHSLSVKTPSRNTKIQKITHSAKSCTSRKSRLLQEMKRSTWKCSLSSSSAHLYDIWLFKQLITAPVQRWANRGDRDCYVIWRELGELRLLSQRNSRQHKCIGT
jgi:hypothetical protein